MPTMQEVFSKLFEGPSEDKKRKLWNQFSKTFSEYKYRVSKAAEHFYGKGWREKIGAAFKKDASYVDRAIRKLWDNNYTDYEAVEEIGFWFDVAQNDPDGYGGEIRVGPKYDNAFENERSGRPAGVDSNGRILYKSQGVTHDA